MLSVWYEPNRAKVVQFSSLPQFPRFPQQIFEAGDFVLHPPQMPQLPHKKKIVGETYYLLFYASNSFNILGISKIALLSNLITNSGGFISTSPIIVATAKKLSFSSRRQKAPNPKLSPFT